MTDDEARERARLVLEADDLDYPLLARIHAAALATALTTIAAELAAVTKALARADARLATDGAKLLHALVRAETAEEALRVIAELPEPLGSRSHPAAAQCEWLKARARAVLSARPTEDTALDEAGSSAAVEDGTKQSLGHHETVGERQGRQPASSSDRSAGRTDAPDQSV